MVNEQECERMYDHYQERYNEIVEEYNNKLITHDEYLKRAEKYLNYIDVLGYLLKRENHKEMPR